MTTEIVVFELLAAWITLSFHGAMLVLLTRLHDMIIERLEKDERREQGISGDRPGDLQPADGDVQPDA